MAYTKQNWECGDLITADKMNHIEDGIEDASSGGTEPLILRVEPIEIDICSSTKVLVNMEGEDTQVDVVLSDASLYELMTAWTEVDDNPTRYESANTIIPVVVGVPSVQTGLYLATQTNGFTVVINGSNPLLLVLPTNADFQCGR